VIGRRTARLTEQCNSVLTIASVIGREFGIDALERASDLPGDRLLCLLEEAVAARLIREVPDIVGRYRFVHALPVKADMEEGGTYHGNNYSDTDSRFARNCQHSVDWQYESL
jgi:hypothetical protein